MQQLKQEMRRMNMEREMAVLDDWAILSEQQKEVTLALIRRLAAERRAEMEVVESPRLRLVVAGR